MSRNKKIIIGVIALAVLIVAALALSGVFSPKTAAGSKSISLVVVDDAGKSTEYALKTDAEYLAEAMDEAAEQGFSYSGAESEYGLYIDTVNGVFADYNTNGAYWAIYVNGEYGNYGIGEQPVADGDEFTFEYTAA